jgi:hypothetical protein
MKVVFHRRNTLRPTIFAQMGMLQAIHSHHKQVFNPDRKDHHWESAS